MLLPSKINTVIVGGGGAGLAMSIALKRLGQEHIVLEQGRALEAWRSKRWSSFKINTPLSQSGLAGQHDFASDRALDAPGVPIGELLGVWEQYLAHLDLPIFEGVKVTAVKQDGDNDGDLLVTVERDGEESTLRARNVVGAVGAYQIPSMPRGIAEQDVAPRLRQLSVGSSYSSPDSLAPGGVLVVGSGQSGSQISDELVDAGREVYLATSPTGGCPRSFRGLDIFDWVLRLKMQEQLATSMEPAALEAERRKNPPVTGADKAIGPFSLFRKGVHLLGRLERVDGETLHFSGDLDANLRATLASYQGFIGALTGAASRDKELDASLPVYTPEPEWVPDETLLANAAAGKIPTTLDAGAVGINNIVWATGWSADLDWCKVEGVRESFSSAGKPTTIESPHPGLFWLGFPWLRTRGSTLLVGFESDAEYCASKLRQ